MDIKELMAFGATFVSMAFGFGRQSSTIATMRRDIDGIAQKNREQTMPLLLDIRDRLARLEQDILHMKGGQ